MDTKAEGETEEHMQERTPVADMLRTWAGEKRHRLHMPGHKGGKGPLSGFDALAWDATELSDTDALFASVGPLKEAMALAAQGFGARYTQFLTAGATSGVLAMLLALEPGSTVVVARDCHKSVAAGIELGRHKPVFVLPGLLPDGTPGCPDAEDVRRALKAAGQVRAVVVTYPNYYGLCADLEAIRAAADQAGALFLVDGAHGTHFACGADGLPPYAGRFADVWVDGAHKTAGAMGQGAFLHMSARAAQKGLAWEGLLRALALVHTSSPSYAVMASLDTARSRLFTCGAEWAALARACAAAAQRIDALDGLSCPALRHARAAGAAAFDPTRLVVDVRGRGLTGYGAEPILKAAGVEVEMGDSARVVALTAPWDLPAIAAFEAALAALYGGQPIQGSFPGLPPLPKRAETAGRRAVELVALERAEGRVAAATVGAYPPGIPALWPGERADGATLAYLLEVRRLGGRLFGLRGGYMPVFAAGENGES